MLSILVVIRKCLFKVNDNRLFNKYTKIWGKVSILMNIEFASELVYDDNDRYIKAKIKSYGDKKNTSFQVKKIAKENASYNSTSKYWSPGRPPPTSSGRHIKILYDCPRTS